MLENLNGLEGIVVGLTAGVIGSYLIYATYHMMGRKAAKERLAEFLDRWGTLRGFDYYRQKAEEIRDPVVRARLIAENERYLGLIREEEQILDGIIASDVPPAR